MALMVSKTFFAALAEIVEREALPFFRQHLAIRNKNKKGFDPVTLADVRIEQKLREYIAVHFPDHGIYGEEEGMQGEDCEYVWVIDPIDGTRSFISGIPLWGTLVGLLRNGGAVAGMMTQPFTKELFFTSAEEAGSFFQRDGGAVQPLAVSKTVKLADATLFSTAPSLFDEKTGPAFQRLEQSVRLSRFGSDCYAFTMLAAGFVDLVVETGLKPYDIVALIPIIEKAGGIVSQWNGERAEKGGDIIAASTPELYEAALQQLSAGGTAAAAIC